MKRRLVTLITMALIAVGVGVWLVLRPSRVWTNEYLHSAIETVEYVTALLMAGLMLQRQDDDGRYTGATMGLGFLGVGILNAAHTVLPPGDAFVFLRTAASLAGGLGFALVGLPERHKHVLARPSVIGTAAAGFASIVAGSVLFPGIVPAMIHGGRFTELAVILNSLAGVFFLYGAFRFATDTRMSEDIEYALFSLAGLLFGLSGLAFKFSVLWSEPWWYWHILRLGGSVLVLVLLFNRHLRTVTLLRTSLQEQREAEASLRRSYERTKTIIDSMNDSISLLDVKDFSIIGVNSMFLAEYGYADEADVVGKHCYEITHGRSTVCKAPDDLCPLADTVRTGKHSIAEHVHCSRTGERIFVEVSTSPITDEQGTVVQVVHVSRDITERKRAEGEREKLLADIARSNRDLEQFASVASHDLKEPLRMVSSYVQLLARKYEGRLDEKADRYIGFAVEGAARMEQLIEGLLAYSRVGISAVRREPVDANHTFTQVVGNLHAAVRESKALVTRDDLPRILGDETQLLQLFQNLIANAIKYRKPGSSPHVHISVAREGDMARFSVKDDGIGIEARHYDRIFQIFQRLHSHDAYAGAGIGLALCKRIVEGHRGRIWLESVPGAGSTFHFTVPIVSEERRPGETPQAKPHAA